MSHRGVEIVIGRLATDLAIRERFRRAPASTLQELTGLGIELTPVEIHALEALDPLAIDGFAEALDPRIQRA